MKKRIFALVLALVMALSLVACGGGGNGGNAGGNAGGNNGGNAGGNAGGDGGESGTGTKYAVILKTQGTAFWQSMWEGVENYAKENNLDVDLYAATSDTDYEGQLAILENCINGGEYAGIAIAPCSGVNLISGVVAANKAGITIVNIDEQFDEAEMTSQGGTCVGFVSSDNESIGYMGAEYLCSLIDEGSQVAIVQGIAGNPSSEARTSGATKAFEDKGMNIVASVSCDWDMQKALDTVAAWLTQFPDLKAIYSCNDGMAAGVRQAIANAGKTDTVLLCGTDGDDDAVQAVHDGNMAATVAQDPANIGATSLQILVDAVANPDNYPASVAPEKTPVAAILVNE